VKTLLKEDEDAEIVEKKFVVKKGFQYGKGKEKIKKDNVAVINYVGNFKEKKVLEFLNNVWKFTHLK
jgi:hypothetical protein